ncbi:hypothetical protein FPV67DRAFT_1494199 [Lyophyllum atratum]|nr:hypothetical protein FPV67DRAFT_1494199 [Lyophyllum atratum]
MATEIMEAKRIAEGPHMLHLERAPAPDGSKKLSASVLTLCHARSQDMLLDPIIDRRVEVSKGLNYSINDMLPNKEQRASILHQAALLAVQTLTTHAAGFKRYADHPLFQFPRRRPLPKEHRTRTVAVASTLGAQYTPARHVALIREAYLTKLNLKADTFHDRAIPCINDAATNNSIRRAQTSFMGSSTPLPYLYSLQLGPGLGDILKKMVKQVIKNHCPDPTSRGGLAGLFRVVNKSHLGLARPQDHEAALSALDSILRSSFLDCWRINCGYRSIEEYAASNPTPEAILALAKKIIIKHAKRVIPKQPDRFPDDSQYSDELSDEGETDMVYRNHRLLTRDIIYIILLKSAIRDADFGRIEEFLGVIAVSLMGAGMENTCEEIMHFLCDLKYVWSEEFGNIMRDSMIANYFKQGSNAMPADTSVASLSNYSRFFYAAHGFEDEWRAPKNMDEAIGLVDAFDEKLAMKNLREQLQATGLVP